MANQITINGRVLFANNNLPVDGVKIELWDSQNVYGLVATAYSDVQGAFSFIINDPSASLISNNTITPLYKTYRDCNQVANVAATVQNILSLTITENVYDIAVNDCSGEGTANIIVNGSIRDWKDNAIDNVKICVFEKGFRSETLIAETKSNISGQYQFKINTRLFNNSKVITGRLLILKAFSGEDVIATSHDIAVNEEREVALDLKAIETYSAPSAFENLLAKIEYMLGETSFNSFAAQFDLADSGSLEELAYLGNAIGHDGSEIHGLIISYKYAQDASVDHKMMHALTKTNGGSGNPILTMGESKMREFIHRSSLDNFIPAAAANQIDTFIAAAKVFQVNASKNIPITGENYTLGDVLNTIFGGANAHTDTEEFLTKYNSQQYANIDAFWADYTQLNSTNAVKAQKGLRLASITGFQPEMLNHLMSSTNSGLHTLAEWSEGDWNSLIRTISQQAGKLCVPVSIKGELTDENEITALYAKKLRSIVQNMFPLTAIKVNLLDSETGPGLIENAGVRSEAVTFIANNPGFDLRISNIYDINTDNSNLSLAGITSVADLQQAMGPLQRVLRIVGSNPSAAVSMISAGHSSAAAITAMPLSSFVSSYSSVLGGASAATAAYASASVISTAATSSLASTYAMGTSGMSYVLPTWGTTTGLSTTGTHADPTLVTLFGNMSYCACDQCMSMYSPAAYYTDILNFLREGQTNPALYPTVFKELMRRRPDLQYIDMTCKNTNTVMPYIDLVIELLELEILGKITYTGSAITPGYSVPNSFQTNGTKAELLAHPEHIYKISSSPGGIYTWSYNDYQYYSKVYDPFISGSGWGSKNLTSEVYPLNLPFSLPAEETRTYLKYLGATRYELMKAYKPFTTPSTLPISDFDIYCELLGLTAAEGSIVARTHPLIGDTWRFYGLPGLSGSVIDPSDASLTISYSPTSALNSSTVLTERLDLLIQQLKITYKEFLQFFTTDFLNKPISGFRPFTVSSKDPLVPDTCDLTKLHIVSEDVPILLGKLHRFVRLWRTNILSIKDWDILFRALRITSLDATDFCMIGRVIEFTKRIGIKVTELPGWWGYMDIHQYVDYGSGSTDKQPSVYDLAYRNRSVINLPLPEFRDLGGLDPWALPSGSLPSVYDGTGGHFTSQIAAASKIKESDLMLILDRMSVAVSTDPVTFEQISAIYSFAHLSRKTGLTVSDLLDILHLLNLDVMGTSASPTDINLRLDQLENLITTIETIKESDFTLAEINYIILNVDALGPVAPSPIAIQTFYEQLRNELQKFPSFNFYITTGGGLGFDWSGISSSAVRLDALHKLMNVVYQHFSKEFNMPSEYVELIFSVVGPALVSDLFVELLSENFLTNSTYSSIDLTENAYVPGPPLVTSSAGALGLIPDLYQSYRYLFKISLIVNRVKLNTHEFNYLFQFPAKINFDFGLVKPALPSATSINTGSAFIALFHGMLQLTRWINVRNKLSLIENQLVLLLNTTSVSGGSLHNRFKKWQDIISVDAWGTMIQDLLGDPATVSTGTSTGPLGILNADFPADYDAADVKSITHIWDVIKILACCLRTGLKPGTLFKVLLQDLTMGDAHQVLLAAKGKHTEEEWAKIARPLRDTLRRKQRDALAGFVVAHPDTTVSSNLKKWRNENDLYAFLLIDTQMDACMLTSRIKQAICSVQLYVDRVLLGLETSNYVATPAISLPTDMIFEWEHWRKWYRIWEADRKVFLYPENWIEPDLRDDKSIFFEEMEALLMQGDITKDRAEDAIRGYLRKVETVAHLEPIGVCDIQDPDTNKFITHAFARTYSDPHQYFYRRLQNYQWTAWERIEIDIKGEHTLPIHHNGRLYLFWLTFREKNIAATVSDINLMKTATNAPVSERLHNKWFYNYWKPNIDTAPNDPNPVHLKQIEITLNWTEYKDGHWQEQKVAKHKPCMTLNPMIFDLFPGKIFENPPINPLSPTVKRKYGYAVNNRSIFEFIVSRFKLRAVSIGELVIDILFPHNFDCAVGQEEDARPVQVIWFNGGDPQPHDWDPTNVVAPTGTVISNNRFVQFLDPVTDPVTHFVYGQESLNIDNISLARTNPEYLYFYVWESAFLNFDIRKRTTSVPILGRSRNGVYKVVSHQNTVNSPLEKGFFYYDNVNTFYARLIEEAAFPSSSSPVSLITAADDASFWYQYDHQIWWNPQTTYGADIDMVCSALHTHKHFKFYFQNFTHTHIHEFISSLNTGGGIDGLLKIQTQSLGDNINFNYNYVPNSMVYGLLPSGKVDFDFSGTTSIYNWELFFHTPMLIAKRLSDNQQFADARKWFHYIFDPTSTIDDTGVPTGIKARFWRFRPFYDIAAGPSIATLDDLLLQINASNLAALAQVHLWEDNPFKPHLIARMRMLSYMKNVVMCYLDNLIAWGDKLFRQDTIESINEATQLYILAANILGPRPQEIPKRAEVSPRTFKDLADIGLDALSNALVAIEHYIDPNSGPVPTGGTGGPKVPRMFYFCLPNNPKILEYWDTVENRLFNIRHCRNISGQVQELPLFEPPIDPALLVRAAAAGIDASSVLDDLSTPPMPYRFSVMLQKANELCNDVKALGNALLSALEKKDAEALALLRSGQEMTVLKTTKAMKQAQIDEAAANIVAAKSSKEVAQVRYNYYSSRQFMSGKESRHISLMEDAQQHQNRASTLMAVGTFLSIIPEFNIQAPFAVGPSFGGRELSALFSGLSTIQSQKAAKKNSEATKTITLAGYDRRNDDWKFQADSAQKEIAQIEKQIIASEIRKAIAEKDLATLELQIINSKETDDFMHSKYTNLELYNWMITQISTVYFQSYQLAYDIAKRAEKCLIFELPLIKIPGTGFIKFGYWDSLKKGLMSADKLQYDIRKMELGYLESNARELELTKHISLAMENPQQLLDLRNGGVCALVCDADMFNLDHPGHYNRRIKSISISIPCVAGPYTTIGAMLTQSAAWIEPASGPISGGFTSQVAIATSSAQNDNGMFELNFRDERYLPFEGSGAICTWNLSMMADPKLRQFDYSTISDVILHVKYTAQFDSTKQGLDITHLNEVVNAIGGSAVSMPAYFSLKHQFANSWFSYANAYDGGDHDAQLNVRLNGDMFPYLCKDKTIHIVQWDIVLKSKRPLTDHYRLEVIYDDGSTHTVNIDTPLTTPYAASGSVAVDIAPGNHMDFKLRLIDLDTLPSPTKKNLNALLDDVYVVAIYTLSV